MLPPWPHELSSYRSSDATEHESVTVGSSEHANLSLTGDEIKSLILYVL